MEDGPPVFRQDFTCPALLLFHPDMPFAYRIVTFSDRPFQSVPLSISRLLG